MIDRLIITHSRVTQNNFDNYLFDYPQQIPELMAYWDFNEVQGPILLDHSGNNVMVSFMVQSGAKMFLH